MFALIAEQLYSVAKSYNGRYKNPGVGEKTTHYRIQKGKYWTLKARVPTIA